MLQWGRYNSAKYITWMRKILRVANQVERNLQLWTNLLGTVFLILTCLQHQTNTVPGTCSCWLVLLDLFCLSVRVLLHIMKKLLLKRSRETNRCTGRCYHFVQPFPPFVFSTFSQGSPRWCEFQTTSDNPPYCTFRV